MPEDIIAIDVRKHGRAWEKLREYGFGEIVDRIFADFCIGSECQVSFSAGHYDVIVVGQGMQVRKRVWLLPG